MNKKPTAPPAGAQANVAQLKNDINQGLTGDKAPGFDPAAAPLGTDEEAGGAPYNPQVVGWDRDTQRAQGASPTQNAVDPGLAPDGRRQDRGVWLITAASAVVFVIAAVVIVAGG